MPIYFLSCDPKGKTVTQEKRRIHELTNVMTLPTCNLAGGTCRLRPQRNGQRPHFSTYTYGHTSTMMTTRAVRAGFATVTRSSPSRQKHAPPEPSPFYRPSTTQLTSLLTHQLAMTGLPHTGRDPVATVRAQRLTSGVVADFFRHSTR